MIVIVYCKDGVLVIVFVYGKMDWVKNVLVVGEVDVYFVCGVVYVINFWIVFVGFDG